MSFTEAWISRNCCIVLYTFFVSCLSLSATVIFDNSVGVVVRLGAGLPGNRNLIPGKALWSWICSPLNLYLHSLIHFHVTQCLIKHRNNFPYPLPSIYLSSTIHGPYKKTGWNLSWKFLCTCDFLSIQLSASKISNDSSLTVCGKTDVWLLKFRTS